MSAPVVEEQTFPVYHGYYSANYGRQHGLFWCSSLPAEFTCVSVQLLWRANHMYKKEGGLIPFGYHELPLPPPAKVNYADPRMRRDIFREEFANGQERYIHLPGFEDLVNRNRLGGFGVVVGSDSYSNDMYGYGTAVILKYEWSKVEGWTR